MHYEGELSLQLKLELRSDQVFLIVDRSFYKYKLESFQGLDIRVQLPYYSVKLHSHKTP